MPALLLRPAPVTLLLILCGIGSTMSAEPQAAKSDTRMSFFVTSAGVDGSANLGGLAGADAHCAQLARRAGAGDRTWVAYLSAAAENGKPAVHARDRIGTGPWFNARGQLIARNLEDLHGELHRIDRHTALDERAERPARAHDVLTGSDAQGRLAYIDGNPATCSNWTASGDGVAMIGHDDRMDADSFHNKRFRRWNGSWNAEHPTLGCDAARLAQTGGAGGFYCFSPDAASGPLPGAPVDPQRYSFRRGVNINHWLADNLPASMLYGADWFDGEDLAWIAAQGFDHVRIWVSGHEWIDPTGDLDEAALAPFDQALQWARRHGLGVVLTMHSLPGYRAHLRGEPPPSDAASPFTDAATRADAAYLWQLVARRYADLGAQLRFELLNQPDADDADAMRAYNAEALAAVRTVSRERVVILAPRGADLEHVSDIVLPDPHTVLSLRFREPEIFSYQYRPELPTIAFPGRVPDLRGILEPDDEWLRYSGVELSVEDVERQIRKLAETAQTIAGEREIYIANIGVMFGADDASTRSYLSTVRRTLERHGLGWAVYDYHTGGAIRGEDGGPTRVLQGLALPARAVASQSGFDYRQGVLIAHWLGDVAPGYRGQSGIAHTYAAAWFDEEDLRWIADHGFDHVQIPVDDREWSASGPGLPEDKIAPFARILTQANRHGLGVVLVYGANPASMGNVDSADIERMARQWGRIAQRFATEGDGLRFHVGEEQLPLATDPVRRFAAYVDAVRRHDPQRFIYLSVPQLPSVDGKPYYFMPDNGGFSGIGQLDIERFDARVGIGLCYWEPEVFTMQMRDQGLAIAFPGQVPDFRSPHLTLQRPHDLPEYLALAREYSGDLLAVEDIAQDFAWIAAWRSAHAPRREIYLKRFGLLQDAVEVESGRRYLAAVVGAARAHGFGWSIYDYESGRAIRDAAGQASPLYPALGLR